MSKLTAPPLSLATRTTIVMQTHCEKVGGITLGEQMKHDRALAYAAFAVVCIVWGTTYLAIRIAVTTMTPFLLTGARYLFAGIVLFIVAKLHGDVIPREPPRARRRRRRAAC